MSLRKILVSTLCAMAAVSLLTPAAFAHGCHGGGYARRAAQPCPVVSCTEAGWHYHNGTAYRGHTHGGGLCNGSCAPLCTAAGCTLTGRHVHNGVIYCGGSHAAGYCSGGCPYTQGSGSWGNWGGHHGCHRGGC